VGGQNEDFGGDQGPGGKTNHRRFSKCWQFQERKMMVKKRNGLVLVGCLARPFMGACESKKGFQKAKVVFQPKMKKYLGSKEQWPVAQGSQGGAEPAT